MGILKRSEKLNENTKYRDLKAEDQVKLLQKRSDKYNSPQKI